MIETLPLTLTYNRSAIIRAVLYFDVFGYPLLDSEVYENCSANISREQFEQDLEWLVNQGIIKKEGRYLLTNTRSQEHIDTRLKGNKGAAAIMRTAYTYSRKIASFPFVEGVCLSGALSKNYYDEHGDIDFFIIAKPGRLWVCRTLLILRYKLLPKRLKKFWCVNYFITSDKLQIPDSNAFTATELAFLIPAVNYSVYSDLLLHNQWYKTFFPNKSQDSGRNTLVTPRPFLKSITEKFLSGKTGDLIDDILLSFTLSHWKKKFPDMSEQDFELRFRSKKTVCKRHTKGFQNKVLVCWEEKQKQFEREFNVSLQR